MARNVFKQVVLFTQHGALNVAQSVSKISLTKKVFDTNDDFDFASEQQALANDWKKVGNDMRKGILKYDRRIGSR